MSGWAGEMLPSPPIAWEDGQAVNRDYADPYFSRSDGAAESRHVFVEGNALQARFATARRFCIGELGFGTGLNLLLAWQLWRQHAPAGARLDYIAVEAAPLTARQMRQALAAWPMLSPQLDALCGALPPRTAGFHVVMPAPELRLLLMYGDVDNVLPRCRARVDAWFLDGFAPARNPAMWSPRVLDQLARLSRPGATLATYSAAGRVRRSLQAAGFDVQRRPGYGRKREMLTGRIDHPPADTDPQPWLSSPATGNGAVTVLGDGIAGACLARQLAEDGREVLVVGAGQGASHRIPGFLVRPYPEAAPSRRQSLYRQAFTYATDFYSARAAPAFTPTALQTERGSLPAAVLRPATAVPLLLAHPRIRRQRLCIESVTRSDGNWCLQGGGRTLRARQLLLCGAEAPAGLDLRLPLQPCAGQVALVGQRLRPAFAGGVHGFALNGHSQIGSSFRRHERGLDVRPQETDRLLAEARESGLAPALDAGVAAISSHTALRITSRDHLPSIGPAPDLPRWAADYAGLRHGRQPAAPADCLPGLWLNLGHGSRGATMAPLAALLLAAMLDEGPVPLPAELLAAVHPGRFVIRALKRGDGLGPVRR